MPKVLSDAEVMGAAPVATPPRIFSDAEVMGGPDALDQAALAEQSPISLLKDMGRRALSLPLATGDLILGVPGMVAGHLMNVGTRLYAAAAGEPRKIAGKAGELAEALPTLKIPGTALEIPLEGLKTPLQTIAKATLGVEPWNQESVSSALSDLSVGLEDATGGVVSAEDARLAMGVAMDVAGAKGLQAGTRVVGEALKPREPVAAPKAVEAPAAEVPAGPEAQVIDTPAKVKKIFAEAKKRGAPAERDVELVKKIFEDAKKAKPAAPEPVPVREDWMTSPEVEAALEKEPYTRTPEEEALLKDWHERWQQKGAISREHFPQMMALLSVGSAGALGLLRYLKSQPTPPVVDEEQEQGQEFQKRLFRETHPDIRFPEDIKKPSRIMAAAENLAPLALAIGALRVVRHGDTALNEANKIRGWRDIPLDERGKAQAEALGRQLSNTGTDKIVASDLSRTADTAKEIQKTTGAPLELSRGLRPWDVGDFTGTDAAEANKVLEQHVAKPDEPVDGGESFNQFKERFLGEVQRIKAENPGKDVTLVTHHRGERLLRAWEAAGSPEDLSIDAEVFKDWKAGIKPGEATVVGTKPTLEHPEAGAANPKLLASLAVVGGGAAAAAYFNPEHPFKAAAMGAGIGALLLTAKPRAWGEAFRRVQSNLPVVRIDELTRAVAYQKKVSDRATYQMQDSIERAVPDVARRQAIYDYLENERPVTLNATEKAVADGVRQYYNQLGETAKGAKVIREMLDDYATRVYGHSKGFFEGRRIGANTNIESPFGKPRGYETRAEAEAAGYTPITTDISQVLKLYSDSINAAIRNKQFIATLKGTELPEGTKLLVKEGKAPPDYQFIDHPQLRGLRVHPDIAADLRFIFDARDPGALVRGLDAINTTQKRLGVSMSLFHAMALEHAMLGATSVLKSPVRGARILGQSFAPAIFGENLAIKMIREGGQGDMVDFASKSGLEFGFERQVPLIQEEQSGFYQAMNAATQALDSLVPGVGKATFGNITKLNQMFDRAMWGRFHAAMKLETFIDKVSELSRNNAREIEAGRGQMKSREEIGRAAASFTNDIFGGLNWQAMVQEFSSRWGRELASAAFSPTGRLGMRMIMFAPDWTISTTRAFVKAFGQQGVAAGAGAVIGSQVMPEHDLIGAVLGGVAGLAAGRAAGLAKPGGSSWRGLLRPTELADLHRQYILRSAFLYSTIVDAVNYKLSGHHFWDNKDPTRLDRGDGTTMQVSKHFMEPIHWLTTPRQQAMNKLSFVVKEPLAQLQDVEYLSATGAPRLGKTPKGEPISLGARATHVAKQFLPISAQSLELESPEKAGWSAVGMPVYGKTYAERAAEKEKRRRAAELKRRYAR